MHPASETWRGSRAALPLEDSRVSGAVGRVLRPRIAPARRDSSYSASRRHDVLGGVVWRLHDDLVCGRAQAFGGGSRLGQDRVRCGGSPRPCAWIARATADPPAAVLGVRELLRRQRLLSGMQRASSDVLGALSRAEIDSDHRLRWPTPEGVRGLGKHRAHTRFTTRYDAKSRAEAPDVPARRAAPKYTL